ncbi:MULTISPECIES: hypothetical protein [Pseudoalteromonas]|uniref:Uncharacterized protein n=1 Tax=Pseudoalteromonas lipolytica TaxID=570156 RepID=A0AAD0WB81_9GAMM|nr:MULTISPECIES: hypothetical protein [Pseudoalteromonas]AXV63954.1 hypothetical protein D0907_01045 [Pseudoalteromonas donghaensis]|tara:strand:- start:4249 stop:4521 length:273 start_codon:yes stop_codon:yes gene_type:complete
MFFLELLYYFLVAFIAIFSWERIRLGVSIPIIVHLKSIFLQLFCTLLVAVVIVFMAILLNISYVVTGILTTLVTLFFWLHVEHFFPRESK